MAVACCAPALRPERVAAAAREVAWLKFLAIVDRHRIAGLCARALSGIAPDDAAIALADRARRDVGANLRAVACIAKLEKRFAAVGIRRLYVKGLTLSALAYGDPFLKASADVDLVVALDDIAAVAAILAESSFMLAEPARLPPGKLIWWHRQSKESAWWRERDELMLDLHSRLADCAAVLPHSASDPAQRVAVTPALALPTLETPALLAYLAVHGASSCWFRLKWIADFAALAARAGTLALDEAVVLVAAQGGQRPMAQALLLGDTLFGGILERDQRARLLDSRMNRHLLALSLDALAADEPTSRRFGTVPIHWNQLLTRSEAGPMIVEAARQLRVAWTHRRLRA